MPNVLVKLFRNYSAQVHNVQPSATLKVYDSTNTNLISQVDYPLTQAFDLSLDAGTYVFRFTINGAITSGQVSPVFSDDVQGTPLFAPGSIIDSTTNEYVSPAVSISSAFNSFQPYASDNLAVGQPTANFDVTVALERCEGSNPRTRRAYFTFENFQTPIQFSNDNNTFATLVPNNWFQQGEVGTTLIYYFIDATNATKQLTVTFTDCVTPPQSAPTLSKTAVEENENLTITFQGTAKVRVYKSNSVVQTITNAQSPLSWNSGNLGSGSYRFTVDDVNGESSKSSEVLVTAGPPEGFCNVPHLKEIGNWEPQGFGSLPCNALKFSNTGQLAIFAQIVTYNPLVFKPRGRNLILRNDFVFANGVTSDIIDCLFGNFTSQGLLPPDNIPLPPGYSYDEQSQTYFPSDSPVVTSSRKRIKAVIEESCGVENFQIGVTNNYSSGSVDPSEVLEWIDGIEAEVNVQDGVYPYFFLRDKTDPGKISNATRTLIDA